MSGSRWVTVPSWLLKPFMYNFMYNSSVHSRHLFLISVLCRACSYAIFFFTASDFTFTTRCIHNWESLLLWPRFFVFLVLLLCSCPVAFWTPSDLGGGEGGGLISGVVMFCLFILFMDFSGQEYWSGLPFPPPNKYTVIENLHFLFFKTQQPRQKLLQS